VQDIREREKRARSDSSSYQVAIMGKIFNISLAIFAATGFVSYPFLNSLPS
jgi:hypothetical protein